MSVSARSKFTRLASAVAVVALSGQWVFTQAAVQPINNLPNPYRTVLNWAQPPDGRKWGSTAGVDVGPDGNIWAIDRCGTNSCADSSLTAILEFDPSGKLLRNFAGGLFAQPHGMFVDKDGNVWVTDDQGSKDGKKGFQVWKFNPDGKVLLTLGKAGVQAEGPDTFGAPTDVVVAPNGDIFVSDGHSGCNCTSARVVKFSKDGKFIKTFGKKGTGPGDFDGPHALAFDSQGRLFVGDRSNNRIEIFTQDGQFVAEWKQFGRPSGIAIRDDVIYVADSESDNTRNPGWHKGIRIGSAKDGSVKTFIEDSEPTKQSPAGAEGVAVDAKGTVYGAVVSRQTLEKHVKQ